jgi:uncharacterized ubiquitin-like protein YukD
MAARTNFALPNTSKPTSGPMGVNVTLDFTNVDNVVGDLALEQMQGVIEYIQSIWIDNSANTKSLSITFSGTQQKITVKAGQQALLPVIAAAGALSWRAQSIGAAIAVPVIMMNQVQQPFLWQAV